MGAGADVGGIVRNADGARVLNVARKAATRSESAKHRERVRAGTGAVRFRHHESQEVAISRRVGGRGVALLDDRTAVRGATGPRDGHARTVGQAGVGGHRDGSARTTDVDKEQTRDQECCPHHAQERGGAAEAAAGHIAAPSASRGATCSWRVAGGSHADGFPGLVGLDFAPPSPRGRGRTSTAGWADACAGQSGGSRSGRSRRTAFVRSVFASWLLVRNPAVVWRIPSLNVRLFFTRRSLTPASTVANLVGDGDFFSDRSVPG